MFSFDGIFDGFILMSFVIYCFIVIILVIGYNYWVFILACVSLYDGSYT